jgi:hypothetical protein
MRTHYFNNANRNPLTFDAIRAKCPSVFAEDKAATRSDRYTFIPTYEVLQALQS